MSNNKKQNNIGTAETESVEELVAPVDTAAEASVMANNAASEKSNIVLDPEKEAVEAAISEAMIDDVVKKPQNASKSEKNNDDISLADRVRIVSPTKLVFKRFFRSRLSVIGLVLFLVVVAFSFIGPAFVNWGGEEIDYSPAKRKIVSFMSYNITDDEGVEYTYYTITASQPQNLNAHAPAGTWGVNEKKEEALHVLGTDKDGYDILVRLMYGGRLSLMLSFLVVLVYTIIGIFFGGLAGFFGGWVDMIIMRIVDIINCLPSLPIMLIIGTFFDNSGINEKYRVYFMMGVLTLMSWTGTTRLVRGQILFLREQEYMVATDALGFSPWRKIFKHLVPNVMPQLIVSMTLGLGGTILTEASLSFLSLGAPPQVASLGRMVNAASNQIILSNYIADWLPAGLIIIIAVVAFNFIGDGLRDALDPKMKR